MLEVLDLPVVKRPALVPKGLLPDVLVLAGVRVKLHHQLAVVELGIPEHDLIFKLTNERPRKGVGGGGSYRWRK